MRNECNIIRDILPLYVEGIVSEDTAAFIEEHLAACPDCTAELGTMKTPSKFDQICAEEMKLQSNEALPLIAAKKRIKKNKLVAIVVTALITALLTMTICIALEIRHLFWFVYILAPIVVLAFFAVWKPKFALLSVPICVALDFIFFMADFLYYEGTVLMLIFTTIQALIVATIALVIKYRAQK